MNGSERQFIFHYNEFIQTITACFGSEKKYLQQLRYAQINKHFHFTYNK